MAGIDLNRTTSGVNLPPQVATEIWANIVQQSAVMASAQRITLPGSGLSIPMISGEASASWVTESSEKPVSRPTLANKAMTPYMLAVIVPFSNQFRRDLPGLYGELARRLPFALAKKFDETVFGVSASPGSGFDTLATAPQVTVDGTNTLQDLAGVFNAVAAAGGNLSHWLAAPSLQGLLLTATDSTGRQFFVPNPSTDSVAGSVFGRPVIGTRAGLKSSTTVGDDTGVAGDFTGSSFYGTVEGIQVSVSDQATLNDGGTSINLWQRNMFAIRAEIEVGFVYRDINHFVRITDGVVDTP